MRNIFVSALAAACALALVPLAAQADSVQYGTSGDWALFRNSDGGQVYSCHATVSAGGGAALLFEHSAAYTVIGFKTARSNAQNGNTQVQVVFNGDPGTAQLLDMPHGPEWRGYQSSNSEPDGVLDLFANANSVSFIYDVPGQGLETATFSLRGSNAATKSIYDCAQNPQAAQAVTPAPAAPRSLQWADNPTGKLSLDMLTAGTMPDGMVVFVCGAYYNGGFHTGMTGMWTSESCNIGYGGQEQRIAPYQVLMGQGNWQAFTGAVPGNAVEGGFEANGAKLYICRGTYNNMLLAGKFRPGFSGCNVGDSGQEIAVFPFDLLTF